MPISCSSRSMPSQRAGNTQLNAPLTLELPVNPLRFSWRDHMRDSRPRTLATVWFTEEELTDRNARPAFTIISSRVPLTYINAPALRSGYLRHMKVGSVKTAGTMSVDLASQSRDIERYGTPSARDLPASLFAISSGIPPGPFAILRDLGMPEDTIYAYFLRFRVRGKAQGEENVPPSFEGRKAKTSSFRSGSCS